VKIYFVETESQEQEFFKAELADGHELNFVDALDEVPPDAESLSIFIYSKVTRSSWRRFRRCGSS